MADVELKKLLPALHKKNKSFYDDVSDDERKALKEKAYLNMRWASCLGGSSELEMYSVMATNQIANKHFFSLHKHPKLQWLLCSSVSPQIGRPDYKWIKPIGRKKKNQLLSIYPTAKIEDLELLMEIKGEKEIKKLLEQHGYIDKK